MALKKPFDKEVDDEELDFDCEITESGFS